MELVEARIDVVSHTTCFSISIHRQMETRKLITRACSYQTKQIYWYELNVLHIDMFKILVLESVEKFLTMFESVYKYMDFQNNID